MNEKDLNKMSIQYKPDLQYTDEYESDIIFPNKEIEVDKEDEKDIVEDLLDNLKDVIITINKLPQPLKDVVSEVVDQIIDSMEDDLYEQKYDRVPEEIEWNYKPSLPDVGTPDFDKDPEEGTKPDEDSIWDMDDFIPIEKEENDKLDIIEKEYIKNLTDLLKYYFTRLKKIISNFWTNLLLAVINKSSDEIKFVSDNILLSSSDLTEGTKHLLDAAIRSQILKNLKVDYYNNVFNAEETIKHIKQFKAMFELRKRYYGIEKASATSKTNQLSNNYLLSAQKSYDIKYDIAFENLFRYLESSNNVLDDLLQTYIQEIKAKQIIIERKGVK